MTKAHLAEKPQERLTNAEADEMTEKLDPSRATDGALHHVEVSFRSNCPPDRFAEALRTGEISEMTRPALTLFF